MDIIQKYNNIKFIDLNSLQSKSWDMNISLKDLIKLNELSYVVNRDNTSLYMKHPNSRNNSYCRIKLDSYACLYYHGDTTFSFDTYIELVNTIQFLKKNLIIVSNQKKVVFY